MGERYGGMSGFLPGRASLSLDLIVVAMLFVLVALGLSVYSVKSLRRYRLHKFVQLATAMSLVVLLLLFEVDIHFIDNWTLRADASPYFDAATRTGLVVYALAVHLVFATTTLVLWLVVICAALTRFPAPPRRDVHSRFHRRWGRIAAIDMVLTTVTGWFFYWLAFVA